MNYKILLYAFNLFLSMFVLSGINFSNLMKTNKELEAKLLVIILGIAFSYMITNFVYDFLNM